MVFRVVDAEAIPLAGDVHQFLDRGQVGGGSLAHRHALALGQADVVAPLGLHPGENHLLVRGQIDVDRAERLDALRAADEPIARHPSRHLRGVRQLRLDLEQGGVRLLAERPRHGDHGAGLVGRGPVHDRAFGHVRHLLTPGQATVQDAGAPQDRRVRARDGPQLHALGRPAERRLQLRPASRLQDVAIGVGRDEIVPHSVGIKACSKVAAFGTGDPDVLRLGQTGVERVQWLAHVTSVFNIQYSAFSSQLSVFTPTERTVSFQFLVSSFQSIPTGGSAARLYTQTPLPVNALRAFPGNDRFCFDTHPPACYDPRMW